MNELFLTKGRYAGGYRVAPYCVIACNKKPRLFHRMMARFLLGWTWENSR